MCEREREREGRTEKMPWEHFRVLADEGSWLKKSIIGIRYLPSVQRMYKTVRSRCIRQSGSDM